MMKTNGQALIEFVLVLTVAVVFYELLLVRGDLIHAGFPSMLSATLSYLEESLNYISSIIAIP